MVAASVVSTAGSVVASVVAGAVSVVVVGSVSAIFIRYAVVQGVLLEEDA